MKKLLFSISLIAALTACEEKAAAIAEPLKEEQSVAPIDPQPEAEVELSDEANTATTEQAKESAKVVEAPKHGSPDQSQIDSIKQAKQKLKKR